MEITGSGKVWDKDAYFVHYIPLRVVTHCSWTVCLTEVCTVDGHWSAPLTTEKLQSVFLTQAYCNSIN